MIFCETPFVGSALCATSCGCTTARSHVHNSELLATFLLICAVFLSGSVAASQPAVPVRELTKPDAASTDHFGFILNIRALPSGAVLVNDAKYRQLILLDSALSNPHIVVDSANVGGQSYGSRPTPIVPYLGDSTLFVDGATSTLLLYGPTGQFVRVIAPPKAADLPNIASGPSAVDAAGNLVYAVMPKARNVRVSGISTTVPITYPSEFSIVVRGNFEKRMVDTLGRVRTPPGFYGWMEVEDVVIMTFVHNPLTSRDEWAVLSDGSVAFVRGHDYHVDIIAPNGRLTSGAKLPFDFKPLTNDGKRALLDSARANLARIDSVSLLNPKASESDSMLIRPPGTSLVRPSAGVAKFRNMKVIDKWVSIDSMEDYWPPIRAGAVKADMDARLWILPTTSAQSLHGELVYDVVDNRGAMLFRVRLPIGRSIAGFGPNGTIYLIFRDANGWVLERSRIVR